MNLLVTGGCGFIGSHYIRHRLATHPGDRVTNLDSLTYAGDPKRLEDVESDPRYRFVRGGIENLDLVAHLLEEDRIDAVVHFAAESHNSRAVLDPGLFFRTNVLGTQTLLEACRRHRERTGRWVRFHHVSTCEVFGDLDLDSPHAFREDDPYRPRTPYNASKAGADHAVRSYCETFGLPATISTCANNYGPFQHPEKVIPLFITQALDGRELPLYRSSRNRREWLHVLDHCRAIDLVLEKGRIGELYNIGSGVEKSIEEIADTVLSVLGKPWSLKTYVPDRPGHDRRYLLDSRKIREELGWEPRVPWEAGVRDTIRWYAEHETWWRPLKERAAVQETAWGR